MGASRKTWGHRLVRSLAGTTVQKLVDRRKMLNLRAAYSTADNPSCLYAGAIFTVTSPSLVVSIV
ncbi:hypothetical protein DENSPDRAFT_838081, partial [Dentipellis sp. KUC8613]